MRLQRPTRLVSLLATSFCIVHLAACGERTLWDRDFKPSTGAARITQTEITGYWEGDVYAGGVRLKIEPASIVAAIKCDVHGDTVISQGNAAIMFRTDPAPPRMVLQQDLAGERQGCGFLFAKGSEFVYALGPQGPLKINFAGTGVSELRKLADLDASNR
jgi:hypothetical protein